MLYSAVAVVVVAVVGGVVVFLVAAAVVPGAVHVVFAVVVALAVVHVNKRKLAPQAITSVRQESDAVSSGSKISKLQDCKTLGRPATCKQQLACGISSA